MPRLAANRPAAHKRKELHERNRHFRDRLEIDEFRLEDAVRTDQRVEIPRLVKRRRDFGEFFKKCFRLSVDFVARLRRSLPLDLELVRYDRRAVRIRIIGLENSVTELLVEDPLSLRFFS